jgi:hypothetical protein
VLGPPNAVACWKEDTSGEIRVPSEALKSIDSLIKFDKTNCKLKAEEIYSPLTTHSGDVPDLDSRIREHLSENHCNYCSCPLPAVYYQSQKEVHCIFILNLVIYRGRMAFLCFCHLCNLVEEKTNKIYEFLNVPQ